MPRAAARPAAGVPTACGLLLCAGLALRAPAAWLCAAPGRRSPAHPQGGARRLPRAVARRAGWEEDSGEFDNDWRVDRPALPSSVSQLASTVFLRHVRDGGPAAAELGGLPPADPKWIAEDEFGTARNVVNALCCHRFGEGVYVESVDRLVDRGQAGAEYVVTLSLSDRSIFGSCDSGQCQHFDRDTTSLLEALKELDGWNQKIYKLKVQTPNSHALKVPDDLWRCEVFPCLVVQKSGQRQYLNRVEGTTDLWRLARCKENYQDTGRLTPEEEKLRLNIPPESILRATVHVDRKSRLAMEEARRTLREEAKKQRMAQDELDRARERQERQERLEASAADRPRKTSQDAMRDMLQGLGRLLG
ncbi:unnamed protein product [Prorocentrum cordatum]|uniref:Uncharacterized protein n=1 Tax=Prorocentrum cordatum TaxID=2364126 RepID=A0ABN9X3S9_9DINO|nr:unnamed protein product [Polarella glacialis]